MAKTMRNIVITCIVLILVATGLSMMVMFGGCDKATSNVLEEARPNAVNAILDSSGIKSHIDSELRSHAAELANELGVSPAFAESIVDSIAVEDWEAVSLPDGLTETSNFSVDVEGTPVEVTTYDDSSVVTVEAYGQEVTFAVPESAQSYMTYLPYLQYVQ